MLDVDVPELAGRRGAGLEREPGLAGPGGPRSVARRERSQTSARSCSSASLPISRVVVPGRRERVRSLPGLAGRRVERRVLGEHRLLHPLQGGARLDAELIEEPGPGLRIDIERLGLAPRAIEGEHEELPPVLAIGLFGDERLRRRDKVVGAFDHQLRPQQLFAEHPRRAPRGVRLRSPPRARGRARRMGVRARASGRRGGVARTSPGRDRAGRVRSRGPVRAPSRRSACRGSTPRPWCGSRARPRADGARAWQWCAALSRADRRPRPPFPGRTRRPSGPRRGPARRGCCAAGGRRAR